MKAFFAIVYELCLDGEHVAKDDPLYETSYIGQAGRYASSAEEVLEMRWYDHKQQAKNEPKEQGIRWALEKYGPEAFTRRVICFLKFEKRCIEALDYMNAVEIEEIDCRGGIMQDIDHAAPVWQTFNLTIGGQGDSFVRFKALQAVAERVWSRFQRELLSYIEEFGTAYVRNEYVSPSGYRLHQFVTHIRANNTFLDGDQAKERTEWLNTLPGWIWRAKGTVESHQMRSAAGVKRRQDPVVEERRNKRLKETNKRIREERWATLSEVEAAEAKRRFEIEQKCRAKKKAKQEAKARGEVEEVKEKKPPNTSIEARARAKKKEKADIAALRETLVPKAQWHQLSRFRQDGTVAKAHQILRERSVDAGV